MNPLPAPDRRNLVILLVAAVLMAFLYGRIRYQVEPYANWDLSVYRSMAAASPHVGGAGFTKPYAYRLLGPWLAGLLPVPDAEGFYLLSLTLSAALVIQFHRFLRRAGLSPASSFVTVLLFMGNKYFFGFTIWDFFQVNDLLALNLLLMALVAMWDRRWVVLGIALALGAVTREVSLLVVPVVFAYLREQGDLSASWKKASAAVTPAVLVFLLVRALVPTVGGGGLLEAFVDHSLKILSPEGVARLLFNSFLPFSFVPFLFPGETRRFFRGRRYALLFFGLVFLSTLFGADNERLMAPAFVVFYGLLGHLIQSLDLKPAPAGLLVGLALASSFHHMFGRWPLPDVTWTYVLSIGATAVTTAGMYYLKRKRVASVGAAK